jgi:hypothetical protein
MPARLAHGDTGLPVTRHIVFHLPVLNSKQATIVLLGNSTEVPWTRIYTIRTTGDKRQATYRKEKAETEETSADNLKTYLCKKYATTITNYYIRKRVLITWLMFAGSVKRTDSILSFIHTPTLGREISVHGAHHAGSEPSTLRTPVSIHHAFSFSVIFVPFGAVHGCTQAFLSHERFRVLI